jgi:hypothetical protein
MTGRNLLKQWFSTAKKPTAAQFAELFDSIFHKGEDSMPIAKIDGLSDVLGDKADAVSTASSIENEATARSNADTNLQTAISDEATARSNADTNLQTAITNEADARSEADANLQTAINALPTFDDIATAVDIEATSRNDADADLQTQIDALPTSADLALKESLSNKNVADGYAGLNSSGLLPLGLFPDKLLGNVKYKGTYNGVTNIIASADIALNGQPLPASTDAIMGYYFINTAAFSLSGINYSVGDWIICDGAAGGWNKVDNSDAVTSVFGRLGNIVANAGDYNTSQVTESGNLYYTDARVSAYGDTRYAQKATTLTGYGITDAIRNSAAYNDDSQDASIYVTGNVQANGGFYGEVAAGFAWLNPGEFLNIGTSDAQTIYVEPTGIRIIRPGLSSQTLEITGPTIAGNSKIVAYDILDITASSIRINSPITVPTATLSEQAVNFGQLNTNAIQNQSDSVQTGANFWIDGQAAFGPNYDTYIGDGYAFIGDGTAKVDIHPTQVRITSDHFDNQLISMQVQPGYTFLQVYDSSANGFFTISPGKFDIGNEYHLTVNLQPRTTGTTNRIQSFQDADGLIALTADLNSYLPLAGGALTGTIIGTNAYFSGEVGGTHVSSSYGGALTPGDASFGNVRVSAFTNDRRLGVMMLRNGVEGWFMGADATDANWNLTIDGTSPFSINRTTKAALFAGDVEISDTTKGVILKSPNGARWRITIDNSGTLIRTSI